MADLESKLKEFKAKSSTSPHPSPGLGRAPKAGEVEPRPPRMLIATDGVFSMDGITAKLKEICDRADKYGALVMVDDSHASGVLGKTGRGSIEQAGVMDRIDILTSTFGKALGGAGGRVYRWKKRNHSGLASKKPHHAFQQQHDPGHR